MKRASEVVYTSLQDPSDMKFLRVPNFQFTEHSYLTRLVDYSFTDVSDNDDDDDNDTKGPLQRLQSELTQLMLKAQDTQQDRKRRSMRSRFSRTLRDRASLRLRTEEDHEEVRKLDLIERLNCGFCQHGLSYVGAMTSPTEIDATKITVTAPSPQTFASETPTKKARLDMNIFKKLSKCAVLRKVTHRKKHKSPSCKKDITKHCLFGLFTL